MKKNKINREGQLEKNQQDNNKNQLVDLSIQRVQHPTKRISMHRKLRKWRRAIIKEIKQQNIPELKHKSLQNTGPSLLIKWHT